MKTSDVKPEEFAPYYGRYIDKLDTNLPILDALEEGKSSIVTFFQNIPEEKLEYRYAEGKWTIKEVLQHIIDTERIFAYRMLRIARHDKTALSGFDQNIYIAPSGANKKSRADLLEEYRIARASTQSMVKSFTDDDLSAIGTANENPMSARAAAFTILGHEIWHREIIEERYL